MWDDAPLSAIQTSPSLLPDCTTNALCGQLPSTVVFPTTLALGSRDLRGVENCASVARSMKELQNDSDETGGICGSGGAGSDCDGGEGSFPELS